ncbi:MAG: hypothetical protein ACREQX_07030 [Candidatus Binataceae bacterium]
MENNCFATGITFPARSEVLRMRNQTPSHYCLQTIRREDLKRLAEIAHHDVDQYFGRKSSMKRTYQTRFLCSALCQGAAIHFALPKYEYGIKDFDVWTFFAQATKGTPLGMFKRRATTVEFGKPRFDGKHVDTLMAHHQRIGKRSCSRGTGLAVRKFRQREGTEAQSHSFLGSA